ncbi:hypothetical protein chiPu_0002343 [Chiloscyllium punctatum]|uniref:Uncharacterized protein n=1 Tax=Chiloscyllium punctatum TaxID=137246 RepID=A0A401S0N9_CHIPU|nr:hypothetical protein [Chiloscyllium punctatum]
MAAPAVRIVRSPRRSARSRRSATRRSAVPATVQARMRRRRCHLEIAVLTAGALHAGMGWRASEDRSGPPSPAGLGGGTEMTCHLSRLEKRLYIC